ncbi:MAG: hypothetical protein RLZZ450_684 [Pseudomonadota bacterium]|jgi:uncharacterized protein (DUF2141 family)
MPRRTSVVTSLLLAMLLGGLGAPPAGHAQAAGKLRAAGGQVLVKVTGFRSARGKVFVALWRNKKDFPGTPPAGTPTATVNIVKGVAEASFSDVPPGVFAVTVLHDEDGDGEMKTNFIGIPKEGIGFSRDARGRFGPPGWDAAKLTLEPGEVEPVNITMLYY